jgi:hypothetical protein
MNWKKRTRKEWLLVWAMVLFLCVAQYMSPSSANHKDDIAQYLGENPGGESVFIYNGSKWACHALSDTIAECQNINEVTMHCERMVGITSKGLKVNTFTHCRAPIGI